MTDSTVLSLVLCFSSTHCALSSFDDQGKVCLTLLMFCQYCYCFKHKTSLMSILKTCECVMYHLLFLLRYWKEQTRLWNVKMYVYSLKFWLSTLTCILPADEPNEVMDTCIGNGDYSHWMYFLLSNLHWEVNVYFFCSCCADVTLKWEENE